MAQYRYYRLTNITGLNNYLEISEITFKNAQGNRVAASILAAYFAPDFGTLSTLDNESTLDDVYWTQAHAQDANFYIEYDFGSSQTIGYVSWGSYDNSDRYPTGFKVSGSNNGTDFTDLATATGYTYPGIKVMGADFLFNYEESTDLTYAVRRPISAPIGQNAFITAINL